MTPRDLVPDIETERMTWLEATTAAEQHHAAAKAIRAAVANRPAPHGRRNVRFHAWWLAGAGWAVWVLDMHATAYRLHARQIEEKAK